MQLTRPLQAVTESKRYEILESLPVYGPMYVPVTENGIPFYSEGFIVHLYKTDSTSWVANFQLGWTDLKMVIELSKTNKLLVIASGTSYLMNPDETNPISVFGVGCVSVLTTTDNRIVLQDQTDLTIVEPNGNHWSTERISWDGFKSLQIDGNVVTGLSYNPTYDADEWIGFSYNLDTKELKGGSFPASNAVKKSK